MQISPRLSSRGIELTQRCVQRRQPTPSRPIHSGSNTHPACAITSRVVDSCGAPFRGSYATSVELDAVFGVGAIVGLVYWLDRDESYERRDADASGRCPPVWGVVGAAAGFSW